MSEAAEAITNLSAQASNLMQLAEAMNHDLSQLATASPTHCMARTKRWFRKTTALLYILSFMPLKKFSTLFAYVIHSSQVSVAQTQEVKDYATDCKTWIIILFHYTCSACDEWHVDQKHFCNE
ncbi:hypothetical protein JMF94_09815 [Desulfovibrio sp. UIB00]|uniref:hypothetical protein n=1 Tax=Desulfovibrio sp. UIB00 TaxID=2804314 RepID=UPI001F10ECE3|nr:hypothetical protein [Desulfovibrio sp. UIB00]MCH5145380.1 hypothetical protein [Desulfovibrio sp. UIB00]